MKPIIKTKNPPAGPISELRSVAAGIISASGGRWWYLILSLVILSGAVTGVLGDEDPFIPGLPPPTGVETVALPGVSGALLTTDQDDYTPGSTAFILGFGFQAGEIVTLQVLHADGTESTGEDHSPWTVIADTNGNIQATWHVCEDDCLGSRLALTAVGNSSGLATRMEFTDSATGSMSTARFYHTATLLPNGKVLVAGGSGVASSSGDTLSSAQLYDPSTGKFSATGSLAVPRNRHVATLLPNGKVLITGGEGVVSLSSAELYDSSVGTFSATGRMVTGRYRHTATLLADGKVLIAGGYNSSYGYLSSAELYDPSTGTFSATSNMTAIRAYHTATLLANGKVLITGGYDGSYLASAEIYDPSTGTFSVTGSMGTADGIHTATLLPNGKVLITGGYNGSTLSSAQLYDPSTGTFRATGNMGTGRYYHTATLLANGQVLITCGYGNSGYLSSSELYDPSNGTFSTAGNLDANARTHHTATLLANGKVLITGGNNDRCGILSSAELYELPSPFSTGAFIATGSLGTARYEHTATLLANGIALITGGYNGSSASSFSSAEVYDSSTGTFSATGSMGTARRLPTATLLINGKVLITGGYNGSFLSSAELYDPSTGIFSGTGRMVAGRSRHTATLLTNGKVLITGGYNGSTLLSSAELYDPSTGTFSATGNMGTERYYHTATLLPNGKVLITGGANNTASYLSSAELYDPSTGTFSATGGLGTKREEHTATLLPNGNVLITGGYNGSYLSSTELYDPSTGTFSVTGNMSATRANQTATLLANSKVLVAGGYNGSYLSSAELYDPGTGTFSAAGNMGTRRYLHTATLLGNGKVLVAGGYSFGALSCSSVVTGPQSSAELYSSENRPPSAVFPASSSFQCDVPYTVTVFVSDPENNALTVTWSIDGAVFATPHSLVAGATSDSITKLFGFGQHIVNVSVTDDSGAVASADVILLIEDNQLPVITGCPANIIVQTGPGRTTCDQVATWTPPTASDNCAVASFNSNHLPGESFPVGTTTVTSTALDGAGNLSACSFTVTVVDNTPPTIACPANLSVGCSLDRLATVSYPAPTVFDNCDAHPTETCTPASGSASFAVGSTTVVCQAVDAVGNSNTCSFLVTRAALGFTGFLPPIGGEVGKSTGGSFADPLRAFKLGSTIPVKFQAACGGTPVATGVHTLQAVKYSNSVDSDPAINATPMDPATTGNQFRLTDAASGEWHFNLDTKSLSVGTWKLTATMSDDSIHEVWITIKK